MYNLPCTAWCEGLCFSEDKTKSALPTHRTDSSVAELKRMIHTLAIV